MKIVVMNSKGGTGKTTLVAAISSFLDADVVDHDNQKTLTIASSLTGRFKPITLGSISKKNIIHDTPPYNFEGQKELIKSADYIIIPTRLRFPDLVAFKNIYDRILNLGARKKTYVVFNEVRKPYTKTYHQLKNNYISNFSNITFLKTEIPSLLTFGRILAEDYSERGKEIMENLLNELTIYKNNKQ